MEKGIEKAAEAILAAKKVIALTGAGISTESGIPDFRSRGGLWEKYNPEEYATIDAFRASPQKVWRMLFDMFELTVNAKPNPGHFALAELEKMKMLDCIITQNIDNLHQQAGSVNVIEYHGNVTGLECLSCGKTYAYSDFDIEALRRERVPPRCVTCDVCLKPTVVFFGEMIPHEALVRSQKLAQEADAVIVAGTSAVVYPAAGIPLIAKQNGATVIEFNIEYTELTRFATDIMVRGKTGTTLPALVDYLKTA